MEDKNNQASEKITSFLRKSFGYYGKELTLESNQHFGIDQILNKKKQQGEYNYHIQYGFPSSGCISINVSYSKESNSFYIDEIAVYALPADKEMVMATFVPQSQVGEINISASFGLDMGTEEHKSISSIAANPNALKMLDIAINDLSQAQILGECSCIVPIGSDRIPCCNSTNISKVQDKKL